MKESQDIKTTNIDEGLNNYIVETKTLIRDELARRNYSVCFELLRTLSSEIKALNPPNIEILQQYEETIENYIDGLGGKPVNLYEKIRIGKMHYEFKNLILQYRDLINNTLQMMGKGLKTIYINADIDLQISDEIYNTTVSLLEEKKELLKSLRVEQILKFCSPKMIHEIHDKYMLVSE